jgi:hypothetical protein
MTRPAMAPAWSVLLVIAAVLCSVAAVPDRTLAQEPEGAGTSEPSQPQAPKPDPKPNAKPDPQPDSNPKPPATPAQPASKPELAQLAWLAGRWQGTWGPRVAHQMWMPPQSGVMVGVFQLTENSRTLVIEIYTMIATPDGIELRVRHFTPTLAPWEKAAPSLLKLMTYDSKSFLFVNQDNGQPKHWLMKRTAPDTFVARFEIVPEKGQPQSAEIVYHRQGDSAPANRRPGD